MNTHLLCLNATVILVGPEHVIERICTALKAAIPANSKDRLCIHTKSAPKIQDGAEETGKAVHAILDNQVWRGYFDQYDWEFAGEWRKNNPRLYGGDGTLIEVNKLYRVNGGDNYGYAGVCMEIDPRTQRAFLSMQTRSDGWYSVSDLVSGNRGPV